MKSRSSSYESHIVLDTSGPINGSATKNNKEKMNEERKTTSTLANLEPSKPAKGTKQPSQKPSVSKLPKDLPDEETKIGPGIGIKDIKVNLKNESSFTNDLSTTKLLNQPKVSFLEGLVSKKQDMKNNKSGGKIKDLMRRCAVQETTSEETHVKRAMVKGNPIWKENEISNMQTEVFIDSLVAGIPPEDIIFERAKKHALGENHGDQGEPGLHFGDAIVLNIDTNIEEVLKQQNNEKKENKQLSMKSFVGDTIYFKDVADNEFSNLSIFTIVPSMKYDIISEVEEDIRNGRKKSTNSKRKTKDGTDDQNPNTLKGLIDTKNAKQSKRKQEYLLSKLTQECSQNTEDETRLNGKLITYDDEFQLYHKASRKFLC